MLENKLWPPGTAAFFVPQQANAFELTIRIVGPFAGSAQAATRNREEMFTSEIAIVRKGLSEQLESRTLLA